MRLERETPPMAVIESVVAEQVEPEGFGGVRDPRVRARGRRDDARLAGHRDVPGVRGRALRHRGPPLSATRSSTARTAARASRSSTTSRTTGPMTTMRDFPMCRSVRRPSTATPATGASTRSPTRASSAGRGSISTCSAPDARSPRPSTARTAIRRPATGSGRRLPTSSRGPTVTAGPNRGARRRSSRHAARAARDRPHPRHEGPRRVPSRVRRHRPRRRVAPARAQAPLGQAARRHGRRRRRRPPSSLASGPEEEALLTGSRPADRAAAAARATSAGDGPVLAPEVAPGLAEVGVMLPYTPAASPAAGRCRPPARDDERQPLRRAHRDGQRRGARAARADRRRLPAARPRHPLAATTTRSCASWTASDRAGAAQPRLRPVPARGCRSTPTPTSSPPARSRRTRSRC